MSELQERLSQLRAQVFEHESPEVWHEIEQTCKSLANILRTKNVEQDNHTTLGGTLLPQHLKDIFSRALHGHSTPSDELSPVIFEVLRVAANLCMDHDENRGHLLEANFPQAVVALLEGYVEGLGTTRNAPLTIPHLRVARTAMGVLLNLSIGYEPVKSRLKSLEVPMTILTLSTATYIPGNWLHHLDTLQDESGEEVWNLRIALANWTWRVISELQDDDSLPIFNTNVLPLLAPPLRAYIPKDDDNISPPTSALINSLIHADFESLEESCTLIESLSLDVQDIRLSLARGLDTPAEHNGVPCLSTIIDFIEHGNYSKLWSRLGADEQKKQKAFDMCKAACIKAVVEVSGEDGNEEVIWDESNEVHPGGSFVNRMVGWIKAYANSTAQGGVRDDLIICGALALGNLTRREAQAKILLSPPHSIAPVLTSAHCLSPTTDIKIMHGVLGLLRHIAQTTQKQGFIHDELSRVQIVHRIAESGVWDERTNPMAEVVQVSAIGVIRGVCIANVENTFAAILPSDAASTRPTALTQLLALIQRADSITIKSEGTRAIVNMVKSLWATSATTTSIATPVAPSENNEGSLEKAKKRQECIRVIASHETALALAALIERSSRYPILINEGVVAMTLLSAHPPSSPVMLEAIVVPVGQSIPRPSDVPSDSGDVAPGPRRALDQLLSVLEGSEQAPFPIEVRINTCSLLAQLSRNSGTAPELTTVKDAAKTLLEALVARHQESQGKEGILAAAAKKVLGIWG